MRQFTYRGFRAVKVSVENGSTYWAAGIDPALANALDEGNTRILNDEGAEGIMDEIDNFWSKERLIED